MVSSLVHSDSMPPHTKALGESLREGPEVHAAQPTVRRVRIRVEHRCTLCNAIKVVLNCSSRVAAHSSRDVREGKANIGFPGQNHPPMLIVRIPIQAFCNELCLFYQDLSKRKKSMYFRPPLHLLSKYPIHLTNRITASLSSQSLECWVMVRSCSARG